MKLVMIFWATAWAILIGGCIYAIRLVNLAPVPDPLLPSMLQVAKMEARDIATTQAWVVMSGSILTALFFGGFGSVLSYLNFIANALVPASTEKLSKDALNADFFARVNSSVPGGLWAKPKEP